MILNKRSGVFKAEWRQIKGFEGLYEVSNLGQVRSLDKYSKCKNGKYNFYKGKIVKVGKDKYGYLQFALSKDKNKKTVKVHRLVAEAFIPNPLNKPQIDHINTNKNNNKVWNLRWVTPKENINNPITLKKHKGENNPMFGKHHSEETKKKLSELNKGKYGGVNNPFYGKKHNEETIEIIKSKQKCKKVLCIETNVIYNSINEAAKETKLNRTLISRCCNGYKYPKTVGGYHFKFVEK